MHHPPDIEAGGRRQRSAAPSVAASLGVGNARAILRLYLAIGCILIPSLGLLSVGWAWVAGLLLAWLAIGTALVTVLGGGEQRTRRPLRVSQEHLQLLMTDRDFDSCDYERLLALDANNIVCESQRATDAEINRLPICKYTQAAKGERNCPICLEEFVLGEECRILPCWHRCHPQCIDPWLRLNAICPVCKFPAIG